MNLEDVLRASSFLFYEKISHTIIDKCIKISYIQLKLVEANLSFTRSNYVSRSI